MVKRRNNRNWIIGGVVLIIVAAVIVGIAVGVNSHNNDGGDEQETTNTEENNTEKREDETDEEFSERVVEEKKPVQYEGDDPNNSDTLTGVISYAGVNNGKLIIRVNIDQYLTSGKCELALERDGASVYNNTADIMADVSTATCEGFDVPVNTLGSGNFKISIKLSSENKKGVINGEVNI